MAKLFDLTKNIFLPSRHVAKPYKYYHFLNTLSRDRLDQILLCSEEEHIFSLVPEPAGQSVLFFNDAHHRHVLKKLHSFSEALLCYVFKGPDGRPEPAKEDSLWYHIKGDLSALALKKESFDLVICPFVLNTQSVDAGLIHRISAVIKKGGRLVLALRHMQLEHMLYNQNPSQTGAPHNSFASYYKQLKEDRLFVEDIIEGGVSKQLKPLFVTQEGSDHYYEYKDTPLTLLIRAVKLVK
ncbi:MAG: class I SAM-dependent methyltransferase [Deltaproteobacteria bacterium]|nr:class I SAM-dependent methyltransferase [Deltaproteobacteria bacterium]